MAKKRKKVKLAVLIGRGGRLKAIYRCSKKIPGLNLILVISHKKDSPGIKMAKKWGIESFCFRLSDWTPPTRHPETRKNREEYNLELAKILKKRKINLIVIAGWGLILSKKFLKQFPKVVMNIHPALCPAFPGMSPVPERDALNYGVKYTGCTLHFVDAGVDTGPIILQKVTEIRPNDTINSLQKRIHKEEEKILCQGIKLFSRGKFKIKGRKVIIT